MRVEKSDQDRDEAARQIGCERKHLRAIDSFDSFSADKGIHFPHGEKYNAEVERHSDHGHPRAIQPFRLGLMEHTVLIQAEIADPHNA